MIVKEAEERFGLSEEKLEGYAEAGYFRKDKNGWRDEDFQDLGLIMTLEEAGFGEEEIRNFLFCRRRRKNGPELSRMLRSKRRAILDIIHEKQKVLDQVDFLIRAVSTDR